MPQYDDARSPSASRKQLMKVIEGPWGKRTIEPPKATTEPATPKEQPFGKGSYTRHGFLPPEDPLFSSGPIVAGRPILKPPKKKPAENN